MNEIACNQLLKVNTSSQSDQKASMNTSKSLCTTKQSIKELCRGFNEAHILLEAAFSQIPINVKVQKGIIGNEYIVFNSLQFEIITSLCNSKFKNIVISSPNKSGKTFAVLLAIIDKLLANNGRLVMLCPTVEIAHASHSIAELISHYCDINICLAIKGKSLSKEQLNTYNILISTPNKILELSYSNLELGKVNYIIFDNADLMSDSMGRVNVVSSIFTKLSEKCHKIIVSNSINKILDDFIDKYMMHCDMIIKKPVEGSYDEIFVTFDSHEEKMNTVHHFIADTCYPEQIVIFCEKKSSILQIKNDIDKELSYDVIMGGGRGLSQNQRNLVLQKFKDSEMKVLISTVSFIQSIESKRVATVINYDHIIRDDQLDLEGYKKRGSLLKTKNGICVNLVDKMWDTHFFKTVSFNNNKRFFENVEIVSASELKSRF